MNLEPRVRSAAKGVLEVMVDGKTIFSNTVKGRVPEPGEIAALIRALQQAAT